jgi:hypothetical protein
LTARLCYAHPVRKSRHGKDRQIVEAAENKTVEVGWGKVLSKPNQNDDGMISEKSSPLQGQYTGSRTYVIQGMKVASTTNQANIG